MLGIMSEKELFQAYDKEELKSDVVEAIRALHASVDEITQKENISMKSTRASFNRRRRESLAERRPG